MDHGLSFLVFQATQAKGGLACKQALHLGSSERWSRPLVSFASHFWDVKQRGALRDIPKKTPAKETMH